ncbi:MAG: response regulator transcription factor [Clostridiales bacterium]|nr:response regulator transcription factor [Clostridiales bacterium]
MVQIAVIEDDPSIGDFLEEALRAEGYLVLRAYSGTEARYLLAQHTPDLVLLDLMLPGLTGEELLPLIGNIPVIVVSAKVGVDDKVNALLAGAADYVTKPFALRELLARITVQLRQPRPAAGVLTFQDLTMDPATHEVTAGGQPVKLTKTEYAILHLLLENPRQVLAKSVILDRIIQETPDGTEGSLKQHMSNLRKKLRQAGGREYIQAVWGIGFRMTEEQP